jgi:hypothetical protein
VTEIYCLQIDRLKVAHAFDNWVTRLLWFRRFAKMSEVLVLSEVSCVGRSFLDSNLMSFLSHI